MNRGRVVGVDDARRDAAFAQKQRGGEAGRAGADDQRCVAVSHECSLAHDVFGHNGIAGRLSRMGAQCDRIGLSTA